MGLNLNLNKKTKKLGKVTGAMFSKKRQQEYKDRNWAMDNTTHSSVAQTFPKPPPSPSYKSIPSFPAPKARVKAPKAPKATKGLVKQKAKALKPIKSKGLASKELIVANRNHVPGTKGVSAEDLKSRPPAKKKAPKLAAKRPTAPKSTKLTRSQKVRAKGEAALKSGDAAKARRLRRRYDRISAREAKRASKKS